MELNSEGIRTTAGGRTKAHDKRQAMRIEGARRVALTIALALGLVLAGAACGTDGSSEDAGNAAPTATTAEVFEPDSTTSSTAAPSAEDDGEPPPQSPIEAAVERMLTATDVGLSDEEWTPYGASGFDSGVSMTSCGLLSDEAYAVVESFAEVGSTGAGEISERVAVLESDDSAQAVYAEMIGEITDCSYSPAGPTDVEAGEASTFVSTDDDAITHIVGVVGSVVYDVSFYGAYTVESMAPRASERAAG